MDRAEPEQIADVETTAAAPTGLLAPAGRMGPAQARALGLQRAAGNAAVARAIARGGMSGAPAPPASPRGDGPAARTAGPAVLRDPAPEEEESPGVFMQALADAADAAVPGYGALKLIAGADPITGQRVTVDRRQMIEELLGHGPFAAGIGPVLAGLDVLEEVIGVVTDGLASHNLTLTRIRDDFERCWNEVSITEGIDGNIAIVERYVDALIADVSAFASDIADQLIAMVRAAAVEAAEPFLQRPEIAPIWNLARKVLHYDPLRGEAVEATTLEILTDFLRLIGQEERLAQMQREGSLERTAAWLDTQFATFASITSDLGGLFRDAWNAISPANLPNLLDTLPDLADRAIGLVRRIGDFARTVIGQVLALIKDALLSRLAAHADQIPGFRLLTVILGRNPFTDQAVPRTAENLIHGFISLLPGGDAIYEQLAESGVIAQAAGRIEGAIARLGITWELITGTFRAIWDGLSLDDLLDVVGAFRRITDQFGAPLQRIFAFIGEVVEAVVTLIMAAMNFPSDLLGHIVEQARSAMERIKEDPVAFLKNMLNALKAGVTSFFGNIVTHLTGGLVNWLTRGLGQLGITIPTDWSIGSVIKLVFDVLGLSVEHLWEKLGAKIGRERVGRLRGMLDRLSGVWEFIKDVQREGIGAVWRHLQAQLSNLWDTLLGAAKDWIMTTVIERAATWLLSLLDPTGIMAVIRSFQAVFAAIQSAIEYIRDILRIVDDYVTTLAEIAVGNITRGAQKLEQGLANAIPVALGFLANLLGISNIPEKITEIIGRVREVVDQAIDWLLDRAIAMGQGILNSLGLGEQPAAEGAAAGSGAPGTDPNGAPTIEARFTEGPTNHRVFVETRPGGAPVLMVNSDPMPLADYVELLGTRVAAMPAGQPKTDATAEIARLRGFVATLTPQVQGLWSHLNAPDANAQATAILGRVQTLATQLDALADLQGPGNPDGDPRAPAPGIGDQGLHGRSDKSSNRGGHPLHWTESEHIIPYALITQFWHVGGALLPDRGGTVDRRQTTLMIYFEAARKKTEGDNPASSAFESTTLDLARRAAAFRERGFDPDGPQYAAFAADVISAVRQAKNAAVARANNAIRDEAQEHTAGHALTNAQRRAPAGQSEPTTPTPGAVAAAADTQIEDIAAMLADAVREARRNRLSGTTP